jgi:hypothetical protein
MTNPPIGDTFIEGSLSVVQIEFDNVDLGYTTDATEMEFIEDLADILYQQFGTQPYDKIPTGQAIQITCVLGQITNARMEKLMRGITLSGDGKSMNFGNDLYRSGRDNFAKEIVIKRVQSDGTVTTDPRFIFTGYVAMPMVTGPVSFEASTQRGLAVTFYLFKNIAKDSFGYTGYPSSLGL